MATARPKTFSTDWKSRDASGAALRKFEDTFAREMGVDITTTADDYQVISTGSLNLDYATGIGGIPTGRITEIHGPEHAGKTTLCILIARNAQRQYPKKKVAWLDMEQTFDPAYATALGLDVTSVWRPPVKTAEEVADMGKRFVESGMCSLVIIDSIGGMISKKEMQKESDEPVVAAVAGIVTRMVKHMSPMAKSNDTAIVVVNQVRSVIDAEAKGAKTHNPGGWALRHITTMKIKVSRAFSEKPKTITVKGEVIPIGHEMALKIEKNKLSAFGRVATVWLYNRATTQYGPMGVDEYEEAVILGKRLDIITGSAWLKLPGVEKPVQGADKAVKYLRLHPETYAEVRTAILATLGLDAIEDDEIEDPLGMADAIEQT